MVSDQNGCDLGQRPGRGDQTCFAELRHRRIALKHPVENIGPLKRVQTFWIAGVGRRSYQHAILNEIPAHAKVSVGDAVVTSGYSALFPEGILIGTIDDFELNQGEGFYIIRVKLSIDFKNLTYIETVEKITRDEQHELEKLTNND
jgi:cell shape-determining protein MreC